MSRQSQPTSLLNSLKQRVVLIDEIWHAAGDAASDIDWYVKRTLLGGIYSASEIYMITDNSPGMICTQLTQTAKETQLIYFSLSCLVLINMHITHTITLKNSVLSITYANEFCYFC
jgi:rpsU-divergently transcribed protein